MIFCSHVKHTYQHGFIIQYISEIMDQVDVIYTDFSKGFDRLELGILLQNYLIWDLPIILLTMLSFTK